MNLKQLNKKLTELYNGKIYAEESDNIRFVKGETSNYLDIVNACKLAVIKKQNINKGHVIHVVNKINFLCDDIPKVREPLITDKSLEGFKCDCLVIGGGISGTSILRELSKYNLNCLLVDKENDLAMQTSCRNDGEVHPGIDLKKGSLKYKYIIRGNRMYDKICADLNVPFKRCGQLVALTDKKLIPAAHVYAKMKKYYYGIDDTVYASKKFINTLDAKFNDEFAFGFYNPMAGVTSPYELTIAYAENAVENGAKVSLSTMVQEMEVKDGKIISVKTNRGTIYPKLVINAAGVFSDKIAAMANDQFYSIHGRKGSIIITDKKANYNINLIASIKDMHQSPEAKLTKGGGSMRTIHGNLLLGPDAEETYKLEDYSVSSKSIDKILAKQSRTIPNIKRSDIITYFSGVRACTWEEDYIIEMGRKTGNLIHVAGIQSPGLTTAPAVAEDVSLMAKDYLVKEMKVTVNESFNPKRKTYPVLKDLTKDERDRLIKQNPAYGEIVCRCEEISKGEIMDCLHRVISVPTIDAVKRRIRPGMGRCQGGFCMPLVDRIIAEDKNVNYGDVEKSNEYNHLGVKEESK